jgi:hypothetical protein
VLQFYQNRVNVSDEKTKYIHTFLYPTFSAFALGQGRGSGFKNSYSTANRDAYSSSYWDGANPTVGNYLIGVGVIWNLTSPLRVQQQVISQ